MSEDEMIRIAHRAIDKGWDFEQLKYGDDLYGREYCADDIWDFVEECKKIGTDAFDKKYSK